MAMQDVINKVKGTALGVAEYLTPVLKVRYKIFYLIENPAVQFCFFSLIFNQFRELTIFSVNIGVKVSRNGRYYSGRSTYVGFLAA